MPADIMTRLRPGQPGIVYLDALYGGHVDEYQRLSFSLHPRQPCGADVVSRASPFEMASSPASASQGLWPSGSRIGRPPQWTISRSRKLARLYLYTTLSIEKIIKVLEDETFKPRYGRHPDWNPVRQRCERLSGLLGRIRRKRQSTRCLTTILGIYAPSPGLKWRNA